LCLLIFVFAQNGTLLIGTSTCEIVTVDITAPDTSPTVFPAKHSLKSVAISTRVGASALAQRQGDGAVRQPAGELRRHGKS